MAASSQSMRTSWVFTINNPTDDDDPSKWEGVKYLCYQKELGEEQTEHYQGYVLFSSNKRLSALKKLNSRAHWEPRKGTHQQAVDYCTKEATRIDGPWTIGTPPKPGERNDLKAIKSKIDAGVPLLSLYDDHFPQMILYKKAFVEYRSDMQKPRTEKTQVSVHWGPPGVGKTTKLKETFISDCFWKDSANKWFDGYDFQKHVVFDEFNGSWFVWTTLKRILDSTPCRVEVKGSSVIFNSSFIHITSNSHPSTWYDTHDYPWMELHRRIEICYKYSSFGQPPTIEWDHLADPPLCPYKDCPVKKLHAFLHSSSSSFSDSGRPPPERAI